MTEIRYCEECGEEFVARRASQIYCSRACYRRANRRKNNERRKEEETGIRIKAQEKKGTAINEELNKKAMQAKAVTMSYGQYVGLTEYRPVIIRKWR